MNARRFLFLFSFSLLLSPIGFLFAQTQNEVHLTGIIKSSETGETISRASVGVIGTSRGTIANSEGRFSIALEKGKAYRLRLRAIGYKPDTISITLDTSTEKTFRLATQAITGSEVVVSSDASRVEARRIITEVIRRKKEWQAKLNDYQCSAYSRWNLRSVKGDESKVQSVLESTADCYWKKDKGFSEEIKSRRQTANFPPSLNAFSVGEILNFYDNRLEFNNLSLTGPVADDAFSSYDYDLTGTGMLNGASVYQISVEPGVMTEGFSGTLWIDKTDYTIAYLDLATSKSVKLGPVKELRFQQTFELFENAYYLPVDLRTNVDIKLQMPLVPEVKFELLSVLQNYSINKGLDDSLFGKKRHRVAPLADSIQKETWQANRLVPLSLDEEKAYQRIDSTVAEEQKDSSSSFASTLFYILSFIDMPRNNSVEGWRFGLSKRITPIRSFPLTLEGAIAYGLNDKLWKYEAGLKQGLIWENQTTAQVSGDLDGGISSRIVSEPVVTLAVEGKYFFDLSAMRSAYNSVENTISNLLNFNSNLGFYYENGFLGALDFTPDPSTMAQFLYRRTQIWDTRLYHLVTQDTLDPLKKENVGAMQLALDKGLTIGRLGLAGSGRFEVSSKQIGSDFTYSMLQLKLSAKQQFGALGNTELIGRYSTLFAGSIPTWHTFFFETRDGIFSKPTYFRGLDPFEFQGDHLYSINLEHDFYDLPVRLLGLHFLEQFDLHWMLHAGIGQLELNRGSTTPFATTANIPYSEIGMGIGNIFNILSIEGTWRLTHKREHNFYPTIVLGFSF
jgi:hypothetical protein